jgi:site-specific DNA-methyltransferase (adenine-specific)
VAERNCLVHSDNLPFMRTLPDASIDLIYADPPFFTGRKHAAFNDVWPGGMGAYVDWLAVRIREMHRLLKPAGSLIVHCDWHASHYIKVALDGIFGYERFVNEIVWCYKSGGASPKRRFSRKHDVLLWYAKGANYYFAAPREKSYNRGRKPYRFAGVSEFEDENGWYTVVGMKDWWEIDMVGRTSGERVNYSTQKPLRLLERVVEACCPANGVVGDFFCGSGTTVIAAAKLGRGWIACDESAEAVRLTRERLERERK